MLLHGLGGTKSSFFDTAAALSRGYRVHALDFPGFGGSSKPATARYGAPFFASAVLGVMDALGIERAHLVGNSMGGRVAIEVGLRDPDARRRPGAAVPRRRLRAPRLPPLVRLLRPSSACCPTRSAAARIEKQFWSLFADRDLVDPSVADVAVDEFERIYRSAGRAARLPRLRALALPRQALRPRRLLPAPGRARAAGAVRLGLPRQADPARLPPPRRAVAAGAEQIMLEGCGHVPADRAPRAHERPPRRGFFARIDALGAARREAARRHGPAPTTARQRRTTARGMAATARAALRAAACSPSLRQGPARSRRPTSTSATRTTSASPSRGCGCSPRSTSAPRSAASATSPRTGRSCSSATTPAAT